MGGWEREERNITPVCPPQVKTGLRDSVTAPSRQTRKMKSAKLDVAQASPVLPRSHRLASESSSPWLRLRTCSKGGRRAGNTCWGRETPQRQPLLSRQTLAEWQKPMLSSAENRKGPVTGGARRKPLANLRQPRRKGSARSDGPPNSLVIKGKHTGEGRKRTKKGIARREEEEKKRREDRSVAISFQTVLLKCAEMTRALTYGIPIEDFFRTVASRNKTSSTLSQPESHRQACAWQLCLKLLSSFSSSKLPGMLGIYHLPSHQSKNKVEYQLLEIQQLFLQLNARSHARMLV
ncbi:hypothetical protein EYF80_009520 [Liparis tanakae]|uniref:Uncharacterized protein n=1 Tax=Liparis tanakae TaxID=230148 RepID=A0A4Z2IQK5_9TELE|nr:hypothetical protein EYF80_009520 [Liparis tanakae]